MDDDMDDGSGSSSSSAPPQPVVSASSSAPLAHKRTRFSVAGELSAAPAFVSAADADDAATPNSSGVATAGADGAPDELDSFLASLGPEAAAAAQAVADDAGAALASDEARAAPASITLDDILRGNVPGSTVVPDDYAAHGAVHTSQPPAGLTRATSLQTADSAVVPAAAMTSVGSGGSGVAAAPAGVPAGTAASAASAPVDAAAASGYAATESSGLDEEAYHAQFRAALLRLTADPTPASSDTSGDGQSAALRSTAGEAPATDAADSTAAGAPPAAAGVAVTDPITEGEAGGAASAAAAVGGGRAAARALAAAELAAEQAALAAMATGASGGGADEPDEEALLYTGAEWGGAGLNAGGTSALELYQSKLKAKAVPDVDHTTIEYETIRKVFYTPSKDIAALTPAQVRRACMCAGRLRVPSYMFAWRGAPTVSRARRLSLPSTSGQRSARGSRDARAR